MPNPIIKTVLKKSKQQGIVKIVGEGNVTISPYDIVHTSQTVDMPNVLWPITSIVFNVKGDTTFTRNGNAIIELNGATYGSWDLAQVMGCSLTDDSNANVSISLTTGMNTIIIAFSKPSGFTETNQQTLQPKDR